MGYNLAKKKMKKNLFVTVVLLIGIIASGMMFSSFTTPINEQNTSVTKNTTSDDNWKKFREGVAYCDADKGTCVGTGDVWVNTETYQVQFRKGGNCYDLTEYTGKDGYNMRFWDNYKKCYYYVYIYIPRAAFD